MRKGHDSHGVQMLAGYLLSHGSGLLKVCAARSDHDGGEGRRWGASHWQG
jgi:hypothetical protein